MTCHHVHLFVRVILSGRGNMSRAIFLYPGRSRKDINLSKSQHSKAKTGRLSSSPMSMFVLRYITKHKLRGAPLRFEPSGTTFDLSRDSLLIRFRCFAHDWQTNPFSYPSQLPRHKMPRRNVSPLSYLSLSRSSYTVSHLCSSSRRNPSFVTLLMIAAKSEGRFSTLAITSVSSDFDYIFFLRRAKVHPLTRLRDFHLRTSDCVCVCFQVCLYTI